MYSRVWAGKVGVLLRDVRSTHTHIIHGAEDLGDLAPLSADGGTVYKYREAGYGSVYVGFTCGVVILSGGDCTPRPPVYPASAGDGVQAQELQVQVWMCGRV